MKVAANFILEFAQPEKGALRYLSHAISHNYLESMPVYKNTLLRDGRFVYSSNLKLKSIQEWFTKMKLIRRCPPAGIKVFLFFFLITLPWLTILWRRGERNQSAVYINSIVSSEKRITGLPSWSYLNKRRHWCVEFYKILPSLRFEHNFRSFSCL